jgi:GT2 family glycosyltransferase
VLTLNPDTELLAGCLAEAVEALQADALLGSVAPQVLQAADPDRLDASGIGLTSRLGAINCEHGLRRSEAAAAPRPVLGPLGGAGLWRRTAVDRAGGWSETQFLYWEDIDLAVRLDRAGYACRTVPTARLLHHGSATVGRWSNRNVYYMVRNHAPSLLATLPGPLLRRHALDLLFAPLRAALLYAGRGRVLPAAAGLLAGLARLPAACARRRHLSRSGTQSKATERMRALMRSADEERRRLRVAAGRA